MDNLLSGLISGLIGAIATIFAAYIARGVTTQTIERTAPGRPLNPVIRQLAQLFQSFTISGAYRFKVHNNHRVHFIDRLNMAVTITSRSIGGTTAGVHIAFNGLTARFPNIESLSDDKQLWSVGSAATFAVDSTKYMLTLVDITTKHCLFDLREVKQLDVQTSLE